MQRTIFFSMLFSLIIAVFAVLNAEPVMINLLWKKYYISQAIVIMASALTGAIIMIPFDIYRSIKRRIKERETNNQIKKLTDENLKLKQENESLKLEF